MFIAFIMIALTVLLACLTDFLVSLASPFQRLHAAKPRPEMPPAVHSPGPIRQPKATNPPLSL
jgi:hypothetical protein